MRLRPLTLLACASTLFAACIVGACASADTKNAGGGGGGGDTSDGAASDPEGGAAGSDGGPGSEPDAGVLLVEGGAIAFTSAVTIYVEPSDNGAALLAAIKAAQKSVHIEMYLMTDNAVQGALVAQHAAGHDVQVILNETFPGGQGNSNSSAFTYLTGKGVTVKYAPTRFTFTHAKTVVIDGTDAWIMTMNTTQSSASSNREFLVLDKDPADVSDAEKIFAADMANQPLVLVTKLVVSPQADSAIDARTRMITVINSATKSLDVMGEELSDFSIEKALVARQKAGISVRVVLSGSTTPSVSQNSAVASLKGAGIPVKSITKPDMHAKAIVADGVRAYVGSQNFTLTSLNTNRELGVLIGNPTEIAKVEASFAADFAAGTAL